MFRSLSGSGHASARNLCVCVGGGGGGAQRGERATSRGGGGGGATVEREGGQTD